MSLNVTGTESAVTQLLGEVRAAPVPALLDAMNPYNATARSKPPRPLNSFILFRAWVGRAFGEIKVPIADQVWNALKREQSPIIPHFYTLSREARVAHGNTFPDYKYRPKKKDLDAVGKKGKRGGKKIRGVGGGNPTPEPSTTSDHKAENVHSTSLQINMDGLPGTHGPPPALFLPQPASLETNAENQMFAYDSVSSFNYQQYPSYEQPSNILSHEIERAHENPPIQGYSSMGFGSHIARAHWEEDFTTSGLVPDLHNLSMPSPRVGNVNWYTEIHDQDIYSSSYHCPSSSLNELNIYSPATDTSSLSNDDHSPFDEDCWNSIGSYVTSALYEP